MLRLHFASCLSQCNTLSAILTHQQRKFARHFVANVCKGLYLLREIQILQFKYCATSKTSCSYLPQSGVIVEVYKFRSANNIAFIWCSLPCTETQLINLICSIETSVHSPTPSYVSTARCSSVCSCHVQYALSLTGRQHAMVACSWSGAAQNSTKSIMLDMSALCYTPTFLEPSFCSLDVCQPHWVCNHHLQRISLSVSPAVRQVTQQDHCELHIHKLTIVDISRDLNAFNN